MDDAGVNVGGEEAYDLEHLALCARRERHFWLLVVKMGG
jgi:hypothetical protein